MKKLGHTFEVISFFFVMTLSSLALGESNDSVMKAKDLYSRITGVKGSTENPVIKQMAALIEAKDTTNAARVATKSLDFYNITLYQFFAPKSVRSESKDVPLNDFIAMGITNTALDRPYTDLLTKNFTVEYKALSTAGDENTTFTRPTGTALRDIRFENLGNSATRRSIGRKIVPAMVGANGQETDGNLRIARNADGTLAPQRANVPVAAGVLTSEKFLAEHAVAGTNRRLVVYAFKDFLCRDIKEWRDGNERISDNHVTKDIPRNPGGNPLAYHNECRTCHQVMDPLRKAFGGFDYSNDRVSYTSAGAGKLLEQNDDNRVAAGAPPRNPFGAHFKDNGGPESWENLLIYDSNGTYFGWGSGSLSGTGVTSFGEMVSRATAFKTCAVSQVWTQICNTSLNGPEGDKIKLRLGDSLEKSNFNLRELYVQVALDPQCNGGLYQASGGSGTVGTTPPTAPTPPTTASVVTFNIAAGTGNGAWNTETAPLVVSMGGQTTKTVRITNLDSTPKVLHSIGGNFCPHQDTNAPLQNGQSYDCVVRAGAIGTSTCTGGNSSLYNHNVGPSAKFCLQIVQ